VAYNANIPQSTDLLSQSQGDILANFQALQTLIDVNHVDFASGNQGKHFFVQFPVQSPVPTTGAGEVGLYCQTSAYTGNPELVVSHQSAAGITEFTSSLKAANGWSYLPSGILLKWGNATANGSTTINFPTAGTIPVFSSVFSMILTPFQNVATDANIAVTLTSFSATSFVAYGSPRITSAATAVTFQYLAIGI
jgi:hypothetical protein